jgi:AcrR family transcriptional regulator
VAPKAQAVTVPARRRRRDGELTRRRVVDAAVETILDLGYYQTSSNEIARRAGVTWGSLQHQFGTREGLLLEVLNDAFIDLEHAVSTADVSGASLEERLKLVLRVLEDHYGKPPHLAHLQILLDLTQNPNTSDETRAAVLAHGRELSRAWRPLFEQALGDAASEDDLVTFAFSTLRGFLLGDLVASRITRSKYGAIQRDLLVRGVAAAVREETRSRGIRVQ